MSRFTDLLARMRAAVATPTPDPEARAAQVARADGGPAAPDAPVERARAWLQQAAQPTADHAARFLR